MLSKINFSKEHILLLHKRFPTVTESTFERTMYAFGLLQHLLKSTNGRLIFKGGTSLMLTLPFPKRVSTDIDILVGPQDNLGPAIELIEHEFPLLRLSQKTIFTKEGIRIEHYCFECPHLFAQTAHVLLDVYYGNSGYERIVGRPLANVFLENDGLPSIVKVPSPESLLGDKMTAFAPSTIGVHPDRTSAGLVVDERLQIIKQFYDIDALSSNIENFAETRRVYFKIAQEEALLHGCPFDPEAFIEDSFKSALSIATQGKSDRHGEYQNWFRYGIQALRDHVFAFDWTQNRAQEAAVNVMVLYACLKSGKDYGKLKNYPKSVFHERPYRAIASAIHDPVLYAKASAAIAWFDPQAQ